MERSIEKCRQYLLLRTEILQKTVVGWSCMLNLDFVYGDDCAYEVSVMKESFNF